MADNYDLVIIGAGSAGLTAASFAARLGARVALVERDRVGGDCTWRGCVPSKALLRVAKIAQEMRSAADFGLPPVNPQVDLGQVMTRVRSVIEGVYQFETAAAVAEEGIEVVHGTARFVDPYAVEVGGRRLQCKRFIICTGARPFIPPISGLADTPYLTYETVFDLRELPRRLLVLGGGPIGVEFAQAFQRLGSTVTLIEQFDRVLPIADPDASNALAQQLAREGVQIVLGLPVEQIARRSPEVIAVVGKEVYVGDFLLAAFGRRPTVAGLDLEEAGVEHDTKGIKVNGRLQTSQKHIYACGDVTGSFQFTHYAGWQGLIAARNALLPWWSGGQRKTVPWVVFTDPEVGQVGLSEREARSQERRVHVQMLPIERIDRAQTDGERSGFVKLVARPNGKLLGATVVASPAGEILNELALALGHGLTLTDLATTMHAYPTYSFAIQQASARAVIARLTTGWRGRLIRRLVRLIWWGPLRFA